MRNPSRTDARRVSLPCPVRIAVLQLSCHPAFAIGESDWLAEPFIAERGPLQRLLAQGFPAQTMRQEFRDLYLKWSRRRLEGVLTWLKTRFGDTTNNYDNMPDILVFPEGAIPRQHLDLLSRFAQETHAIIFAGTHVLEIGQEALQDYVDLGVHGSPQEVEEKLTTILNRNLPTITVLPIFSHANSRDQKSKVILRLRPKVRLSPMELTEIGHGAGTEPPTVVTLRLPSRRHRTKDEPSEIDVLPLVCSEALDLSHTPPNRQYQLAVIVSYNEDFSYFRQIIEYHVRQQIPVAYCNDGHFGSSTVAFLRDARHAHAFYDAPHYGRLPAGDGILIADVTLGINAPMQGTASPAQFTRLVSLSPIVHNDERLPAFQIASKLDALRKEVKDNPFTNVATIIQELATLEEVFAPDAIQQLNVTHLRTLLDVPRNAYLPEWNVHAFPCIVGANDPLPFSTLPARAPDWTADSQLTLGTYYSSLSRLEEELAVRCYFESGRWFDRPPILLNAEHATVLASVRNDCRSRMGQITDRVLAQLERHKGEARERAKERLVHIVGKIVEQTGATSGWLFLIDRESSNEQLRLEISHNTPRRYVEQKPTGGIIEHVRITKRPYLCNHVTDSFGHIIDPYYETFIPTTRSEVAVPIFAPDQSVNAVSERKLLGVLNLESNRYGAFLPVLVGDLQAVAATLVPELLVLQATSGETMLTGWHPDIHGWGTSHLLDRFCLSVATAASKGAGEPGLTCTIWNYDRNKRVLYARGTLGFDYEYLTSTLHEHSFTGKVALEGKGNPRVYRLDVNSPPREWRDFCRKRKIEQQGVAKLIVTPIYKTHAPETVGALNLYFYRHDESFLGSDPAVDFTDDRVRRLAELASRLVHDVYRLKESYLKAYLIARLSTETQHGLPPFEVIKDVLARCFEAGGCSLFLARKDGVANDFACVATTGLAFHGLPVPPSQATYTFEDCLRSEAEATSWGEVRDGSSVNKAFRGLTQYLLARGGRILRMLDVADREELVTVIAEPRADGIPPGTADRNDPRSTIGPVEGQHFVPVYQCSEVLSPAEALHHRYLGVSFGAARKRGEGTVALGLLRLIRSMNTRPFVRHDALLLGDMAQVVFPLFQSWHDESEDSARERYVRGQKGNGAHLGGWFERLLKDPVEAEVPSKYIQEAVHEAVRRLLFRYTGAVRWNRQHILGLLQDLLLVFARDGAVIADLRFAVVGADGELFLRPFHVVSKWSHQPPDEERASDVSSRHVNNGWDAMFSGTIVVFRRDQMFTPIHRDSVLVTEGVVVPFRTFGNGHAIAGVLSLDFAVARGNERLNWSAEHLSMLALVARQFAWMADDNCQADDGLAKDESGSESSAMVFFESVKVLAEQRRDLGVEVLSLRLYSTGDGKTRIAHTYPNASEWVDRGGDDEQSALGRDTMMQYLSNRVDPIAEFRLHGMEWDNTGRFWFPLYLGVQVGGKLQGRFNLFQEYDEAVRKKNHDERLEGTNETDPLRRAARRLREFALLMSEVTVAWNRFANGNAPMIGEPPLWSITVSKSQEDEGRIRYRTGYDWRNG